MSTGITVALGAFGTAIGFEVLNRVRQKYGRIPWQFTAGVIALSAVHIYLGMAAVGGNWPFQ